MESSELAAYFEAQADVDTGYREESWDETIYSEQARDDLLDNDAISPTEAAFMDGYEEAYRTMRFYQENNQV